MSDLGRRGFALPVALWSLVVLAALTQAALLGARLDIVLASSQRDHTAALAAAEAGLAEAMRAIAGSTVVAPDSVEGTIGAGAYRAVWFPSGERIQVTASGRSGRSGQRRIEAWVSSYAGGGLRISAWRDVR